MTPVRPLRDAEAVNGHVRGICFKTGPPGRVGAELEWLVARRDDPAAMVPVESLRSVLATAGAFPGGSLVTFEPGGQVELSSLPAADVAGCCAALAADVAHLQSALTSQAWRWSPQVSTRTDRPCVSSTGPAMRQWRPTSTPCPTHWGR